MRIAAHGIVVEVPDGWDARIGRRSGGRPVLHASSAPLPADDGDFATGAAETLPAGGLLVVLAEYAPRLAGEPLFAHARPERVDAADASPQALVRRLPGQAGLQRFFSEAGRAFCLYVVVSADGAARRASADLAGIVGSLAIDPAGG